MEERVDVRRAVTESLVAEGHLGVFAVLTILALVARVGAGFSILTPVSWIATAFSLGYLISYSREVACRRADRYPSLTDAGTHLRRGLSSLLIGLPAYLLTLPIGILVLFVVGFVYRLHVLPREMTFLIALIPLVLVAFTLNAPLAAVYVIEDRIARAFELKANYTAGWRNRRLLWVPVGFAAFTIVVNAVVNTTLAYLLGGPVFSTSSQPPELAQYAALESIIALLFASVVAVTLELVLTHLIGQYSALLDERRVSGLTSASSRLRQPSATM